MIKLFVTLLFISNFVQADVDCTVKLADAVNFSTMSKTVKYKWGEVTFTPSLNSNKLMISAGGKVLSIVNHRDNLLGILSKNANELVLITKEENYFVAQDLLSEQADLAYFNLNGPKDIRVGNIFISLSRVKMLNANSKSKNNSSSITSDNSNGRSSNLGPDDIFPRTTTRDNGMESTEAERIQADYSDLLF